jgi:POT family proton-dependent oligopeptide transporter
LENDSRARADRAFFGHPKALGFLAGTEYWERFSFYGMQALLMLYMTKHLLTPGVAEGVVGLAQYRAALVATFGPMTDLALAAQTFGLYSGLTLATPMIGAWLGDRVLGRTKTITLGTILMSAGHLTMAFEPAFLLALLLLVLGAGCLVGNLQAQIGSLYSPTDERRVRGFGIYLIALNIGALIAPLVCGTLGEEVAWHWGFGAAGIGMLIGLATYLAGRSSYPPDTLSERARHAPLSRGDWKIIALILVILIPRILGNAAFQQAYGLMFVWADGAVDRSLGGWTMPVTWMGTIDGLATIGGVYLASALWKRWAAKGREPNNLFKLAIGCAIAAAAFFYVGFLAGFARVPLLAWVSFYVLLACCYGWFDPPLRSLVSRYAPPKVTGMMMAVSNLAGAMGFFLLGWLGRFYEPLGPSLYFTLLAVLPLSAGVLMVLVARPIMRRFRAAEDARLAGEDTEALDNVEANAGHALPA